MAAMDMNGMNFTGTGTIMSLEETIELRKKKGQCVTCGRQTHKKKMFKMDPITVENEVLEGRCLRCKPLDGHDGSNRSLTGSNRSMGSSQRSGLSLSSASGSANASTVTRQQKRSQSMYQNPSAARPNISRGAQSTVNVLRSKSGRNLSQGVAPSSRLLSCGEASESAPPASGGRWGKLQGKVISKKRVPSVGFASVVENARERQHERLAPASPQAPSQQPPPTLSVNNEKASAGNNSGRNLTEKDIKHHMQFNRTELLTKQSSMRSVTSELSAHSDGNDAMDTILDDECDAQESHPAVSQAQNVNGNMDQIDPATRAAMKSLRSPSLTFSEIFTITSGNAGSPIVQREALRSLINLKLNDADKFAALQEGGALAIIEAMTNHQRDVTVQEMCCGALSYFATSEENRCTLANYGGLESILSTMQTHEQSDQLQSKACMALANLSISETVQVVIIDIGLVACIISAMSNHSLTSDVQLNGISVLTNLVGGNDGLVREKVATAGGIDSIVISMVMHPEDPDIQENGCKALRNLCTNDDNNKVLTEQKGGIDAIISAMQVHRGEARVQTEGCWALSNLAVNPNNKIIIGDSMGIDVIIRAMWVHMENPSLQEWACRALWTLSVNQDNKAKIVSIDGVAAIISAMKGHLDNPGVQEKACGCLANLAANNDDNKLRIAEGEGIDSIVMAMVVHAENQSVQEKACGALRKMATEPFLNTMRAHGVGPLLEAAAQRFPASCSNKASFVLQYL